jgi:predicted RNA-binding protein with PIN domain
MATSTPEALLLVDGYNIIGTWCSLKKTRDRHGLELARQELVEVLINYTAHQGFLTQVVFDAHYQKTPGMQEKHTPSLSVYYTPWSQTADTYIEKVCAQFRHQSSPSRLIVATSDRAQKLTVVGYGAEWMSALQLSSEVETTTQKIRQKNRHQKQHQGRFLFHSLDAKAQERLAQLRRGCR